MGKGSNKYIKLIKLANQRDKWVKELLSNKGIFQVRKTRLTERILGPHIKEDGSIVGGMGVIEAVVLGRVATDEQFAFWEALNDSGKSVEAREFAFVITGAYEKWRRDIKEMLALLIRIELREKALMEENEILNEALREARHKEMNVKDTIDLLKRRMPFVGKQLDEVSYKNEEELLGDIGRKIQVADREENIIISYLEKLREYVPVLFYPEFREMKLLLKIKGVHKDMRKKEERLSRVA